MQFRIRPCANSNGFSLVEIMVALGISAIVALAVMQYFAETMRATRRAQVLATAQDLRMKIETMFRERHVGGTGGHWLGPTVAGSANGTTMACWNVLVPPGCTAEAAADPQPFVMYNIAGSIEIYSITATGFANRGFTHKGEPCTTFDDTNGDANCVFGYELNWKPASCAAGCVRPPLIFNAIMHYRPYGLHGKDTIDSEKYSVRNFIRSVSNRAKSFQIFVKESPSGTGGGACTDGTPVTRVWTAPVSTPSPDDPFGMITLQNSDTEIVLAKDGTYNCTLMAKAFGVEGFSVSLLLNGASVGVGSGYAPANLDGTATLEVAFSALEGQFLTVTQTNQSCTASGSNALGRPVATTTQSTFVSLNCFVDN
jgi:prepilin-type N-terminal cleavage/methylation domain-containing protein